MWEYLYIKHRVYEMRTCLWHYLKKDPCLHLSCWGWFRNVVTFVLTFLYNNQSVPIRDCLLVALLCLQTLLTNWPLLYRLTKHEISHDNLYWLYLVGSHSQLKQFIPFIYCFIIFILFNSGYMPASLFPASPLCWASPSLYP